VSRFLVGGQLQRSLQKQSPILFLHSGQRSRQLFHEPCILRGLFELQSLWKHSRFRWPFAFVEDGVQRNLKRSGPFFYRLDSRGRVIVLDSRDVTAQKASPLFNIPLAQPFGFPQGAQSVADQHDGPSLSRKDCLRQSATAGRIGQTDVNRRAASAFAAETLCALSEAVSHSLTSPSPES
jgi:hypothetical protein